MHQFLKQAESQIDDLSAGELSLYCPLDFFSENSIRLRRALSSLFKTPQNNFKCFKLTSFDSNDVPMGAAALSETGAFSASLKPTKSTTFEAACALFTHVGTYISYATV